MKIRKYLGAAQIYLDAEPLLENAMNAVQSPPQVDSAMEDDVRAQLLALDAIQTELDKLECLATNSVGNIDMDAVRARAVKLQWARTRASNLAIFFGLNGVIRDCFSQQPAGNIDMPVQMSGRRAYG